MSKQNALANLMAKLSVDPMQRRRFQEDPSVFGAEVGLSTEELALLMGGNSDQIRAYLGGDAPAGCFALFTYEAKTTG